MQPYWFKMCFLYINPPLFCCGFRQLALEADGTFFNLVTKPSPQYFDTLKDSPTGRHASPFSVDAGLLGANVHLSAKEGHCLLKAISFRHSAGVFSEKTAMSLSGTSELLWALDLALLPALARPDTPASACAAFLEAFTSPVADDHDDEFVRRLTLRRSSRQALLHTVCLLQRC